ncbi:MAG: DUF2007 domain-containing protein [Firmicutes bacterium]|nr:DUF2007 domain-containing protein [Bacillota bacterium]
MNYLATVDETVEIEMFRELLESNSIPLLTKHRETGEFMVISAGTTIFGADLYVDESQYDEALALYEAYFAGKIAFDEAALADEALHAENPEELFYDETNACEED